MKHSIKRLTAALTALIALMVAAGCKYGAYFLLFDEETVDSRATSVTSLPLTSSAEDALPDIQGLSRYSFVIITDSHFGAAKERYDDEFCAWFETQLASADEAARPRFVANLGDTLNAGAKSEADDYNSFCDRLKSLAAAAGLTTLPVYTILGNHDLYNNGWNVWKHNVYPYTSYYQFSLASNAAAADASAPSGFSYYFLDSANGTLGSPQLEDLLKHLEADARPKLIFTHYAIYGGDIFYFTLQDTIERNLLISACAKNNVRYVFAGHDHKDHRFTFENKFQEHVIASFLYGNTCALVTVDENAGTVSSANITF